MKQIPPATQAQPAATAQGWLLEQVSLRRGNTQVFDQIDMQLDEPRIGLIGHNGAGKTSLLRMLCGLEPPQHGHIAWRGQQLHSSARTHAPSHHVGLMFQNPDDQIIFPTVEEELALSWQGAHQSHTGKPDRKACQQGVQQFLLSRGLQHWGARAISTLSQGQRQWVCWLALLLAQPQVLLLDEPYASLDLPGQIRLATDIETCSQQVIVSTHVLEYVRHYPRVLWLEQGKIRADGPGDQVCAAYEASVRTMFGTGA